MHVLSGKGPETATVNKISSKDTTFSRSQGRKKSRGAFKPKSDKACYWSESIGHSGRDPRCPARGQTCHKCIGRDHFAKVCKTRYSDRSDQRRGTARCVHTVGGELSDCSDRDMYAFMVREKMKLNMLPIVIGGQKLLRYGKAWKQETLTVYRTVVQIGNYIVTRQTMWSESR